MHKHENSSKYKTKERNILPVWPNASLAMSGKELICLRILGSAADFVCESSSNIQEGLGSPFSSRPRSIDVLHAVEENVRVTKMPPIHPALLNTNGNPNIPTPIKMFAKLKIHCP
mmetsp:Transcript_18567/g.22741  ORF Transcript_18567/g.22741 Transcript_18567/m.22741 type:complete len:115 (+) Transcript_18567:940-1284(+)